MQIRVMARVGIVCSLLCFIGACTAANILLHVKKHHILYLSIHSHLCYLTEKYTCDYNPTNVVISVSHSKCVLVHARSLLIAYYVHMNLISKISLEC